MEMTMNKFLSLAALAAGLLLLQGCDPQQKPAPAETAKAETATPVPAPAPRLNVVNLQAVGKTFIGPSEIPSGWTTFKFGNASDMVHFAMIDVPPEGVTAQTMNDTVMQPFQDAMDAMNAGDEEAVNAAFAKFPPWVGELGRNGGPGMLSPGMIGQTTVFMRPGHYIIECYVKSDGVFHTTSPGEGQLGMVMDLTVTDEDSGADEPVPDVTLNVTNAGFEIVSGEMKAGVNTVRVNFVEQQALPSFVGNDVHVMYVSDEDSIAKADAWMDWRTPDGLQSPSPVLFLGGINDLPAGAHGYFTVSLEPGEYAFIAEIPNPQAAGFVLPFSVPMPE